MKKKKQIEEHTENATGTVKNEMGNKDEWDNLDNED